MAFFDFQKKVWKTRFSKKELYIIRQAFVNVSDDMDWVLENIDTVGDRFWMTNPRPETDRRDGWIGIQPKQVFAFKKRIGLKRLQPALSFLKKTGWQDRFLDDDFLVDWSLYFDFMLKSVSKIGISAFDALIEIENKDLLWFVLLLLKDDTDAAEEDVVELIGLLEELIKIDVGLFRYLNHKRFNSVKMCKKDILYVMNNIEKFEEYFSNYELFWEKEKYTPRIEAVRKYIHPKRLDKKSFKTAGSLFFKEGIQNAEADQQVAFCKLYNCFGKVSVDVLKKFNKSGSYFSFFKDLDVIQIDEELVRGHLKYLSLDDLSDFSFVEFFSRMRKEVAPESRNLLLKAVQKKGMAKGVEFFKEVEPLTASLEFKEVLLKYNLDNYPLVVLETLWKEYLKGMNNPSMIPSISGQVDKEYSFEILARNNPEGAFVGYITDCCMTVDSPGYKCLLHGLQNQEGALFVVRKNGKIIAQSWTWVYEKRGFKGLCFDSIELLGRDLDKSQGVLTAYKMAAKLFKAAGFDLITAGADGNSCPSGMSKLGQYCSFENKDMSDVDEEFLSFDEFAKYSLSWKKAMKSDDLHNLRNLYYARDVISRDQNIYTDADEQQIIIEGRE